MEWRRELDRIIVERNVLRQKCAVSDELIVDLRTEIHNKNLLIVSYERDLAEERHIGRMLISEKNRVDIEKDHLAQEVIDLRAAVTLITSSMSWRITAPLRTAVAYWNKRSGG